MKLMNMKRRYWTYDLQLFAGGDGDDPGDSGDDDPEGDDDDADGDDGDDDPEDGEKKFSQKEVDEAVKSVSQGNAGNGRGNSRKLEAKRNLTARGKPEMTTKRMMKKHRNSVARQPKRRKWS